MLHDLIYRNPSNDGFVVLNANLLRQLRKHRQRALHQPEAGGILMGMRRGRHIDITYATTPKREDRRTRTAFDRASEFHQQFAIRAWQRFDRRLDYLGEWHTHPEHNPKPSAIDRVEWSKLMRSSPRDLVFAIFGISGLWVGISSHGVVQVLYRYN